MTSNIIEKAFTLAQECAVISRNYILSQVDKGFSKEQKKDKSFVTEIDLETEKILRAKISEVFPDHGIVGEELPSINPDSPWQWYLDPIDGTENLIKRIPTYGSIIALHHNGESVVGLNDHPELDITVFAARGHGCWIKKGNQTSKLSYKDDQDKPLSDGDIVGTSTYGTFSRNQKTEPLYLSLAKFVPSVRNYYDCFSSTALTTEGLAGLVEVNVKPWDIAAIEILVKEAGGEYVSLNKILTEDRVGCIAGRRAVVLQLYTFIKNNS